MSTLGGPEADRYVKELRARYHARLEMLMQNLASPYPYGAEPVSEMEQYAGFQQMLNDPTGQARIALVASLERKYAGFDDSHARVQKDLTRYYERMNGLDAKFRSPQAVM